MRLIDDQVFPVRLDGRVIYKATSMGAVMPEDFPDPVAAGVAMAKARAAAWETHCALARKDSERRKATILELLGDLTGDELSEVRDAVDERLAHVIALDRAAG